MEERAIRESLDDFREKEQKRLRREMIISPPPQQTLRNSSMDYQLIKQQTHVQTSLQDQPLKSSLKKPSIILQQDLSLPSKNKRRRNMGFYYEQQHKSVEPIILRRIGEAYSIERSQTHEQSVLESSTLRNRIPELQQIDEENITFCEYNCFTASM